MRGLKAFCRRGLKSQEDNLAMSRLALLETLLFTNYTGLDRVLDSEAKLCYYSSPPITLTIKINPDQS